MLLVRLLRRAAQVNAQSRLVEQGMKPIAHILAIQILRKQPACIGVTRIVALVKFHLRLTHHTRRLLIPVFVVTVLPATKKLPVRLPPHPHP